MVSFGSPDRTLAVGPSSANKCGGELFPWQLQVDAGQLVNVTLVQFAVNEDDLDAGDDSSTLRVSSHDVIDGQYDAAGDAQLSAVAILNDSLSKALVPSAPSGLFDIEQDIRTVERGYLPHC